MSNAPQGGGNSTGSNARASHSDPTNDHQGGGGGGPVRGRRGRGRGRGGGGRGRARVTEVESPDGTRGVTRTQVTLTNETAAGSQLFGRPVEDVLQALAYTPASASRHPRAAAGWEAQRAGVPVRSRHSGPVAAPPARPLPPPQVSNLTALPTRAYDLANALISRDYECMSCLDVIELEEAVWSCSCCYSVFHLSCIQRWSNESKAISNSSAHGHQPLSATAPVNAVTAAVVARAGAAPTVQERFFACPQCRFPQPVSSTVSYHCFCGKAGRPSYDPFIIPHSCGNTCGKRRSSGGDCPHTCTLQCHPGPCAECTALIGPTPCPCGSTTYTYRCGTSDPHTTCNNTCGKLLACGQHTCERTCHTDACGSCERLVPTNCVCGREQAVMRVCGADEGAYHCTQRCDKLQSCGHHRCPVVCHDGECPLCPRDVAVVDSCPCGAKALSAMRGSAPRTSCLDPIPCCGGICGKPLLCGRHTCRQRCHEDDCPPCSQKVDASCRCRLTKKLVPCAESEAVRCTRLCGTRLSCGRHYCHEVCCGDRGNTQAESHHCLAVCGQKLPCGHRCEELCHAGACPPCIHFTSETLICACGRTQLPPPQPCGTTEARCPFPCQRPLPCGHEPVHHRCHTGPCPDCVVPVPRTCVSGHDKVTMRPCHESPEDAVCDEPCLRLMPCGHRCQRTCHRGPCATPEHPCTTLCDHVHAGCGHVCGARCHDPLPCPTCKVGERVSCACGRITRKIVCEQLRRMLQKQEQQPSVDATEGDDGTNQPNADEGPNEPAEAADPAATQTGRTDDIDEEDRASGAESHCDHGRDHEHEQQQQQQPQQEQGEVATATTNASSPPQPTSVTTALPTPGGREVRVLPCNEECARQQRLAALASVFTRRTAATNDAAALTTTHGAGQKPGHGTVPYYYSIYLWNRALDPRERHHIDQAEKRLRSFAEGPESLLALPPANAEKRALYHALAPFYGVQSASYDEEPKRSVILTKMERPPYTSPLPNTSTTTALASGPAGAGPDSNHPTHPTVTVPPVTLLDAVRHKRNDPVAFFNSIVHPAAPSETEANSKVDGSKLSASVGIMDSAAPASRKLIHRCIHVIGTGVNEAMMNMYLRGMIGSFVYGDEVHLDNGSRTRATLVFPTCAQQREGFALLRKKEAPFRFWIPEE